MSTSFTARLKSARLARGVSQKALGLAIGIEPSVASARMNQYERGTHQPDFGTVKRLAATLDVPTTWFYAEDDHEAQWVLAWHRMEADERIRWLAEVRNRVGIPER